ncbi:MAG: hypothetical protein NZ534_03895 [Bacteroidia bacterium]|nr:hypothetical protein [Bacteroidia bacterium]
MAKFAIQCLAALLALTFAACSESQMDAAVEGDAAEGVISSENSPAVKRPELARAAKPKWRKVAAFTGKKGQKTPKFKIGGGEWKVEWDVKKAAGKENTELILILHNARNKHDSEILTTQVGPGKDFADFEQSAEAEYYFDVNSELPYEIIVSEYK